MMIDFALEAERERGHDAARGDLEACLLRFRPIMMTTMAALLGALPLALGPAPAPSCAARSASPSSAVCCFRSCSRSTRRRSSISRWSGCAADEVRIRRIDREPPADTPESEAARSLPEYARRAAE